jgi:hypothetical protein
VSAALSPGAGYALYAVGMTPVPELKAPTRAQVQAVKGALMPWSAGHMYLNFADSRQPVETFWRGCIHTAAGVKATVDPDDVIRANHPVPPAR